MTRKFHFAFQVHHNTKFSMLNKSKSTYLKFSYIYRINTFEVSTVLLHLCQMSDNVLQHTLCLYISRMSLIEK